MSTKKITPVDKDGNQLVISTWADSVFVKDGENVKTLDVVLTEGTGGGDVSVDYPSTEPSPQTVPTNADMLGGVAASEYALKSGSCNYANSAGSADTVDGFHFSFDSSTATLNITT